MTVRPRLILIALFCPLAAAVIFSQQTATTYGYQPQWMFSDVDGLPDDSVELLPPLAAAMHERRSIADEQFEPRCELLPPLDPPQVPATVTARIQVRPVAGEPQSLSIGDVSARPTTDSLTADSVFEHIHPPRPAAILDDDVLEANAADDAKPATDGPCDREAKKIWSGNVELGLDGTEGNSQTFNFHIGFDLKRKTKRSIFTSSIDYNKANSDSLNTANRLFQESRLERPHCTTPWTWYVHESVDYDEFQPWNVQINADTGIGYQLVETDSMELTCRCGGGFSQEIDGPEDGYVPELLFGAEFERRVNRRHKYKLSVEYFPDVTNFNEYRMVDKAAWEILLDADHNLNLSLNATNTINRPNPGGKPSDLDYSAVLLWSF